VDVHEEVPWLAGVHDADEPSRCVAVAASGRLWERAHEVDSISLNATSSKEAPKLTC
jgi:hypothetical protein